MVKKANASLPNKIPNPKLQIPNKFQAPKFQRRTALRLERMNLPISWPRLREHRLKACATNHRLQACATNHRLQACATIKSIDQQQRLVAGDLGEDAIELIAVVVNILAAGDLKTDAASLVGDVVKCVGISIHA